MKLITELCHDISYALEEKEGRKQLYVTGPYISVDTPNRNNRIYPKSMMEPIVESFLRDKVRGGCAYGEFGHPNGPKINEDRISHRIVSLDWDNKNVVGKALVQDEGPGKLLRNIIETGGRVGMSTRGLGSVKPNSAGLQEVQSDFKLVTVDAVTDPSGAGCWVNGIMENAEWVYDAVKGTWMESRVEPLRDNMRKMSQRQLEENYLRLFKYYLSPLSEGRRWRALPSSKT